MSLRVKWPLVQISVSGISPELWEAFYRHTKALGMTIRAAVEQAFIELDEAVRTGETIIWPHPKPGQVRTIQIHDDYRKLLKHLSIELGYKQNIVVLAAIGRWMVKP